MEIFVAVFMVLAAVFVVRWLIYVPDDESISADWQNKPTTAADLPEVPAGPAQGAYPTIGTVCTCCHCGGEKRHYVSRYPAPYTQPIGKTDEGGDTE